MAEVQLQAHSQLLTIAGAAVIFKRNCNCDILSMQLRLQLQFQIQPTTATENDGFKAC